MGKLSDLKGSHCIKLNNLEIMDDVGTLARFSLHTKESKGKKKNKDTNTDWSYFFDGNCSLVHIVCDVLKNDYKTTTIKDAVFSLILKKKDASKLQLHLQPTITQTNLQKQHKATILTKAQQDVKNKNNIQDTKDLINKLEQQIKSTSDIIKIPKIGEVAHVPTSDILDWNLLKSEFKAPKRNSTSE